MELNIGIAIMGLMAIVLIAEFIYIPWDMHENDKRFKERV